MFICSTFYSLVNLGNNHFFVSVIKDVMVFEEFDYSIDIINFVVLCIIKFWQVFDAIVNDLFVSDFVDIFFIEPFGNKIFKEFLIFVDVV